MVICPIARAVHCTGCPFFNFCPVKTILGDYGQEEERTSKVTGKKDESAPEEKPGDSNSPQ